MCQWFNSVVVLFHFAMGLLRILAAPHTYPVVSRMGIIWFSPIPMSYDSSPGLHYRNGSYLTAPHISKSTTIQYGNASPEKTIPFSYHPAHWYTIRKSYILCSKLPYNSYLPKASSPVSDWSKECLWRESPVACENSHRKISRSEYSLYRRR